MVQVSETIGFVHFSPGCACGENSAGELFVDPVCLKKNEHLFPEFTRQYLEGNDKVRGFPIENRDAK